MADGRKSLKVRQGDVFQFKLTDHIVGYGQVVVAGDVLYVIIFKDIHEAEERDLRADQLSEIALCGWTLDGRLYHDMWEVVGNAPLPEDIPYPCYKVANDGVLWVESFDGRLERRASEKDVQSLDYRTTVAPIRFEKALGAIHDLCEWDESFDRISLEYGRDRQRAC